jgi:hypothetical protein
MLQLKLNAFQPEIGPNSLDLAIADFYLFRQLKWQLSGRTINSEHNASVMVIEILSELPKDEVKSTSLPREKRS